MEDLAAMITQFLNSEEGMAQLGAVSKALGIDIPQSEPQNNAPQGFAMPNFQNAASSQAAPQIDINTLMMMQRAISMMGQEDKNTELLRALKPHFSPERAKKVDDAIKLIRLIRLLPIAKEMGIFNKFKEG